MYRRTRCVQFSTERIAIAVFAVVGFGMRVRCSANVLKVRFRQGRLVCRQRSLSGAAAAEENNGDERRENG
jgi:hypothetical protein